jgi:hypothetical protein
MCRILPPDEQPLEFIDRRRHILEALAELHERQVDAVVVRGSF